MLMLGSVDFLENAKLYLGKEHYLWENTLCHQER